MTRRLILIRHAHSPQPRGVEDHERPLSERGRQQAFSVAEELVERDWLPQRTLCSDATRAEDTWAAMKPVLEAAGGPIPTKFTNALYAAAAETIREQIWGVEDDTQALALVGHNPGWSEVASWVTGTRVAMPKAAAVLVEVDGDSWAEAVQESRGRFVEMIRPPA